MPSLASTEVEFEVLRRGAELARVIGGAASVWLSTTAPRTRSWTSACQSTSVATSEVIDDSVQLTKAFRLSREDSVFMTPSHRDVCSSMACGLNHARLLQCLPRHDEVFEEEERADKPESTKYDLT